jgi:hypothetical protein
MTNNNRHLHITTELKPSGDDDPSRYYLFVAKRDEELARTAMAVAIQGKAAEYGLFTEEFTSKGVPVVAFGMRNFSHDTLSTDMLTQFDATSNHLPYLVAIEQGLRESEVGRFLANLAPELDIKSRSKPMLDKIAEIVAGLNISYKDQTHPTVKFEGSDIVVDNILNEPSRAAIVSALSQHFKVGSDFITRGNKDGSRRVVIDHASVLEQQATATSSWALKLAPREAANTGPSVA